MKQRPSALALIIASAAALAGCASSANLGLPPSQSWALEVGAPRGTCIYHYSYEWVGAPMLELDRPSKKKGCGSLSGLISMDVRVPRSHFVASWTDEAGTHRVDLDLQPKLAGRALSELRIELSPEGARVFIREFDKSKVFANGLYGDKPELLLFTQQN